MTEIKAVATADIEIDREALDASIAEFAGKNGGYYAKAFRRIQESIRVVPLSFNIATAMFGPLWAAMRGVWAFFWTFLLLEIIAFVQIGRGAWGNLGGDLLERAAKQLAQAQVFLDKAKDARDALEDPSRFETLAANLTRAAAKSREAAEAAASDATFIMIAGLALLAAIRIFEGMAANIVYERQYGVRTRTVPPDTLISNEARTRVIDL